MERYGFVYQFLQLNVVHKQCELRFHVALALAHLLQKSREHEGLYTRFFAELF